MRTPVCNGELELVVSFPNAEDSWQVTDIWGQRLPVGRHKVLAYEVITTAYNEQYCVVDILVEGFIRSVNVREDKRKPDERYNAAYVAIEKVFS